VGVPRQPARQTVRRRREAQTRRELMTQLWRVAAIAVLAAAVAALVATWDRLFPVPPEKLLTVYWTHECRCAHSWIRSLESDGFVVRDFEIGNLRSVRERLQTPEMLRGCHVGTLLDYFVEGHVPPEALRRLADERPPGRGVARASDLSLSPPGVGAEAVVLFDDIGVSRPWPAAPDASKIRDASPNAETQCQPDTPCPLQNAQHPTDVHFVAPARPSALLHRHQRCAGQRRRHRLAPDRCVSGAACACRGPRSRARCETLEGAVRQRQDRERREGHEQQRDQQLAKQGCAAVQRYRRPAALQPPLSCRRLSHCAATIGQDRPGGIDLNHGAD
jgi:hypothetical protein